MLSYQRGPLQQQPQPLHWPAWLALAAVDADGVVGAVDGRRKLISYLVVYIDCYIYSDYFHLLHFDSLQPQR